MAIYHFSAKVISRASGRSAVAAAAYRSASELQDDRLERAQDFTAKTGVVHSEILLPEGAPDRLRDRATLWNEVEATEKRKDAQLAREVEFAIPREMGRDDGIALARDFVDREFVERGMVADLNVHWDHAADGTAKPHAHVMLTMRAVGPDGFGKKVREWNGTDELVGWRERWGEHVNARLAELGFDAAIDHRSLNAQGITLEPQGKIGPAGARREERGEGAERADEHRLIARRNGERISAEPDIALRALTHQHSTFTKHDLARLAHRHSEGADQFALVMGAVEASPEVVHLGEDGRGHERFSTREMIATEARMADTSVALADRRQHRVSAAMQVTVLHARGLGDEQEAAFRHVTDNKDLALVVGYAGTGKSTMLGAAREAWEASGYTVRGATLSGIAAENLEAGSGIGSRTIASLEHAWGQGRDELTSRDVLVIDESGMVGSRQMDRVLSRAAGAGAKLVLVGDPEQLQAIEAGAAFRALAERHGAAEITTVRRQREDWQRAATKELATGRTGEALGRYDEAGMVESHATRAEARAAVVTGWDAARQAAPEQSSVILAYTRADVRELNELARGRMREAGVLGEDRMVSTERGERAFAEGDRIMFLRNERGLGVKNGTLGIVERVGDAGMAVRLDGAERREVTFDLKDYAHVDHGYAATVHKAQGVTVDRAHVLATPHMDRHAAYVGLTRHREGVSLHYGRDDFRDGKGLAWSLGRERAKDTTLDYATGPGEILDHQAGFAERRGIIPRSEIVVPSVERPTAEAATAERTPAHEMPQRSMFAGLKLESGAARGQERVRDGAKGQAQAQPSSLAGLKIGQEQGGAAPASGQQSGGLEQGVEGYARAFADAERMRAARLPVLAHQELALQQAGERLDAADRQVGQDLRSALDRNPGLAAGGSENRAALTAAIDHERKVREDPGLRAERYVERWGKLEEAHDADRYGKGEDDAKQAMRALAGEIKRDPQAESVMKARGDDLGIEHGSRLSRVVEAPSEREAMRLGRSQGLSR
jgi:Ti-type conjugative transfer relaxase TraA